MPPGEPEGVAAEVRELATGIITSLAASNRPLVKDFAEAFAGHVAIAHEYLVYSAELSSTELSSTELSSTELSSSKPATEKDRDSPEHERSQDGPDQLESELRALFGVSPDELFVIVP